MSEETPDLTPMSSPANDIRKIKTNSAASAGELLSWLSKMRGKSPQEVLGTVAKSNLFQSFLLATFLMALLIFGWTAAVWGYDNYLKKDEVADTAEVEADTTPATTEAQPDQTVIPDNVENPDKAEMPDLDLNNKQKVADKLGIGEVKEAPANFNPLDDSDDDLLKGLE